MMGWYWYIIISIPSLFFICFSIWCLREFKKLGRYGGIIPPPPPWAEYPMRKDRASDPPINEGWKDPIRIVGEKGQHLIIKNCLVGEKASEHVLPTEVIVKFELDEKRLAEMIVRMKRSGKLK